MSTAAALVIGDEILTGKVQDQNSYTLAKVLFQRGVQLKSIETVPDDIDVIVASLQKLSASVRYVFTSGGIGPTHDDKTYEAVAKAFGRQLLYHEPTKEALCAYLSARGKLHLLNESRLKMALLPTPCHIISIPQLWVPLVVVENVYVLPGVPDLFAHMLEGAASCFEGLPFYRVLLYTHRSEGDIAYELARWQAAFMNVSIGSYPRYDQADYAVMVSLEGRDKMAVELAAQQVAGSIEAFRWVR